MKLNHHELIEQQFGDQAQAYMNSSVHAQGADLKRLDQWLDAHPDARLLDLGCGAGHASFVAATKVTQVMAYDLSEKMLTVVKQAAKERELSNLQTCQGKAESLPFDDGSFDVVVSRYSAHHWPDVGRSLKEIKRILVPGGKFILMDIVSPGHPVLDIYLQTVEVLRDTSHVRDYSQGEWMRWINEAGLTVRTMTTERLYLDFGLWVARMRTPDNRVEAIRTLQKSLSEEVKSYYQIREDGSFSPDTMMLMAQ